MPIQITSVFVVLLVMLCSQNAYARSDNKGFVSPSMALTGGKLFFAAIERSMYTDCQEQNADMWDMDQKDRENNFKCVNVFKDFHDSSGLNQYKKADALAKVSYSKLKRALISDSVVAGGAGEPPEGCDAHHIVPEHEGRAWAKDAADRARDVLAKCDIGLNSVENGIFLPNGRKYPPGCVGMHHPSVHTKIYYESLSGELERALENNGCEGVKDSLNNIKQSLMNNSL